MPRVAVMLLAHAPLAAALKDCATHVYSCAPEALAALYAFDVAPNADLASEVGRARAVIEQLDCGRGVLVLTDLFGASPANIAAQLAAPGRVEVVTGVSLPMLLRTLCYCDQLTLLELTDKALAGGVSAVMRMAAVAPQNQRVTRDGLAAAESTDHAHARLHHQQ